MLDNLQPGGAQKLGLSSHDGVLATRLPVTVMEKENFHQSLPAARDRSLNSD
jgi:hypothetical protein